MPRLLMPTTVVNAARRAGVSVHQCESVEEVLSETDVLYVTRVQKERFASEAEWAAVKDAYRVDHSLLARAKEEMIVMHPLPRVNGKFIGGAFWSMLMLIRYLQKSIRRSTLIIVEQCISVRCDMVSSCVPPIRVVCFGLILLR